MATPPNLAPAPAVTTSVPSAGTGPATADRVPAPAGPESAPTPSTSASPPYTAVATRSATLDQLPERAVVAPAALHVGALGLDAAVVGVGADPADAELAVPPRPDVVAWYEHGSAPGEGGVTVLAAHVDWDGRRGPFFALADLEPGAAVRVTLDDGRSLDYVVTSVQRIPKSQLPRAQIFDRAGPPRLVLVTCGGEFDRARGHYRDNVVAWADPA